MPDTKQKHFAQIEDLLARLTVPNATSVTKDEMLASLRQLDEIVVTHGKDLPKDLVHYLQRRSYEKARNFLRSSSEK